jgi:hypothetical protein
MVELTANSQRRFLSRWDSMDRCALWQKRQEKQETKLNSSWGSIS